MCRYLEYEEYVRNWHTLYGPTPENPLKANAGRPCTFAEFNRSEAYFNGDMTLEELIQAVQNERNGIICEK